MGLFTTLRGICDYNKEIAVIKILAESEIEGLVEQKYWRLKCCHDSYSICTLMHKNSGPNLFPNDIHREETNLNQYFHYNFPILKGEKKAAKVVSSQYMRR